MSLARQGDESQGGLRLPWLTLASGAGLVLLYGLFGPAPERLIFDRDAIAAGQLWRLVTGHLVHSDPAHLVWNLAALGLLGTLYELRREPSALGTFAPLLAGAAAVDLWLWWLEPGWARYCGLSGALNALYAALALLLWRETRSPLALLLLLGDLAKIALEAAQGGALLPTSSWTAVPGAHLAGLAAGTALHVVRQFLSNPSSTVLEWGLWRANVALLPWHRYFGVPHAPQTGPAERDRSAAQ